MESDEASVTAFRSVADEGGHNEGRRPARSGGRQWFVGVGKREGKYIRALLPVYTEARRVAYDG